MFSKNTYFEEKHVRAAASIAFEKYLESTEKKRGEKQSRGNRIARKIQTK